MKAESDDIIEEVRVAVLFDEPKRTELFNSMLKRVKNKAIKQNISLIKQRIANAG